MDIATLKKELAFKTSRSSGSGGQHVNKVETRVELNFNVAESQVLSAEEKEILIGKWKNKINKEGVFQIAVESSRSQIRNKAIAIELFLEKLQKSLVKQKPRVPSKPNRSAKEKRLKKKKVQAEKKERRKKP